MPESKSSDPTIVPRAQRFPIVAPIRYRETGDTDWSDGTTVNISGSGVLFRSQRVIEPKTMLEMQILLTSEILGGPPADVVCWGPVVRIESGSVQDASPCLAAAILRYDFRQHAGNR